ncbi:unnamed protein product [Rhizophagus irregularis]|uniref:Uncharacterized protein n=1 Tax=Rhizophagus irregularis TaxID=588596 RepID=A0A2I1H9G9_9GLOM|nr:hypothetical protein RhiirA4_475032 [Rhizophagus irregularis]CAB4442607.1 unnamed protein product [Rhizophagus irregularis]
MYFSTFLKIIFAISLCFLTLNIEAYNRHNHCRDCHNTVITTKTESCCTLTKTLTQTKTKTVTCPAKPTKCTTTTTITSPITTFTTTTTTTTTTATETVSCLAPKTPCDLSNPGQCCSLTCFAVGGCA